MGIAEGRQGVASKRKFAVADISKIRIKMGEIEVEYEGTESFLRDELPELLAAVSKLHHDSAGASGDRSKKVRNGGGPKEDLKGTTGTLAGKLSCKVGSGKELITAAAARLTFVLNKDSFTRAELLAEAKTATSYYKKGVANNLSNTLDGLVKSDDFTEIAKGTYSLSATKREELETRLAS